jgi:hypothetical protein
MSYTTIEQVTASLARKVSEQTEISIMSQLNDFISRGLIEIKKGPSSFVQHIDRADVEYRQTVELVLKDKQYIEQLEDENKKLRELIGQIRINKE